MEHSDIEQSESRSRRRSSLPPASQEQSTDSSGASSRRPRIPESDAKPSKERKHRVQFGENVHIPSERPIGHLRREASSLGRPEGSKPMPTALIHQKHTRQGSRSSVPQVTDDVSTDIAEVLSQSPAKPSVDKFSLGSDGSDPEDITEATMNHNDETEEMDEKAVSQRSAHSRAQSPSRSLRGRGNRHASSSRSSMAGSPPASPPDSHTYATNRPLDLNNIPLEKLAKKRTKFSVEDESDTDEEGDNEDSGMTPAQRRIRRLKATVANLIGAHHVSIDSESLFRVKAANSGNTSGQATPIDEHGDSVEYIERPPRYRTGVLGSLMRLYHNDEGAGVGLGFRSAHNSPTVSGASTPIHRPPLWYKDDSNRSSTSSLTGLLNTTNHKIRPGGSPAGIQQRPPLRELRSNPVKKIRKMRPKRDEVIHISRHIEEQLARYTYLQKLCKALMDYGAPTHRLEEYLRMSARVLEINAKFLFIPGCMLISFEDPSTLATDVRLVRAENSIDLGKLHDMYLTYKAVLHDRIGASEGTQILEELSRRKPKFSPWVVVLFMGLASASVGPFAFEARLIDLPIAFILGCLLGFLKIILSTKSDLYSNVFEVSAAVLTSFLARALGSINGGGLFCFSALAQSSIALILPGYIVLCSALELQSRNIVAGSVRMVYAIIYSLFLGFGITIGTSVYGSIDKNATSEVQCRNPLSGTMGFIFVPMFTFCLIVINQGKWSQMPVMLGISMAGYVVNHFSVLRFASNVQVGQTLGALAIGVLGNLYSRFFHGLSAAALLPAIFVQVPSGLAASGSLISGLASANQITNGTINGTTTVSNATAIGTPLAWPEAQQKADQVRAWGIEQLLAIWNRAKGKERDALLWGDEIEYLVVAFEEERRKVKLSLRQAGILDALAKDEKLCNRGGVVPDLQAISRNGDKLPVFHPEFGRFMLESTPGKPWGIGFKDLLDVEPNMNWRREIAKDHMEANEYPITMTTFPRLGTKDEFATPHYPLSGERLRSQFLPDEIANPHIRFPTLAANIRSRRGRKVEINVPIFKDVNTPVPFKDPTVDYDLHKWPEDDDVRNGAAKVDHVYMDAMAFGMGSCCLQITFQAKNLTEGRKLYDQLSPLGPIMLALTAATPIYKGFLVDTDVRWNQISRAVDDRTAEELGEAPLKHDRWRIPKSRYASNSTYISEDPRLRPEHHDPNLIIDPALHARLVDGGMDPLLATHFAHLFIRDPLVIFAEDLEHLDLSKTDHFENLQSTNWQHIRFKPPPADADIGWRVEFRPMEIQMTDFENAAFAIFIVLITRAILSFELNFYIPIVRTTENMETAHNRDAVLKDLFHFRKDPFPPRAAPRVNGSSTSTTPSPSRPPTPPKLGPVEEDYTLMSIDEIINGRTDGFPGLIPLVESYLNSVNVDVETRCDLARYLDLIRKRASGEWWTGAKWIREFVRGHGGYKGDSAVGEGVVFDLVREVEEMRGSRGRGGRMFRGEDVRK